LDIFHSIYKADHFQDNPFHWTFIPREDKYGFFTEYKYTVNQRETIEFAHELRQIFDQYSPERFMVGEIFADDQLIRQYLGDGSDGMHMIFLWKLKDSAFKADLYWKILDQYEKHYPQPYSPVLVLGNHDSRRWIECVGGDLQKAKLIALLQLTARGVPVVYYGEEIGLPEGKIPARGSLDPVGQRYAWAPNWLLKILNLYVNRDNCRTPMAWDGSATAGFSDGNKTPWLPLSADPTYSNVASQRAKPDSLLNWYRLLLTYRKDSPELQHGTLKLLPKNLAQKNLLGYFRQAEENKLAVLINMGSNLVQVDLAALQVELQTGEILVRDDHIRLDGFSGCVIKVAS
jgi:glycosidase